MLKYNEQIDHNIYKLNKQGTDLEVEQNIGIFNPQKDLGAKNLKEFLCKYTGVDGNYSGSKLPKNVINPIKNLPIRLKNTIPFHKYSYKHKMLDETTKLPEILEFTKILPIFSSGKSMSYKDIEEHISNLIMTLSIQPFDEKMEKDFNEIWDETDVAHSYYLKIDEYFIKYLKANRRSEENLNDHVYEGQTKHERDMFSIYKSNFINYFFAYEISRTIQKIKIGNFGNRKQILQLYDLDLNFTNFDKYLYTLTDFLYKNPNYKQESFNELFITTDYNHFQFFQPDNIISQDVTNKYTSRFENIDKYSKPIINIFKLQQILYVLYHPNFLSTYSLQNFPLTCYDKINNTGCINDICQAQDDPEIIKKIDKFVQEKYKINLLTFFTEIGKYKKGFNYNKKFIDKILDTDDPELKNLITVNLLAITPFMNNNYDLNKATYYLASIYRNLIDLGFSHNEIKNLIIGTEKQQLVNINLIYTPYKRLKDNGCALCSLNEGNSPCNRKNTQNVIGVKGECTCLCKDNLNNPDNLCNEDKEVASSCSDAFVKGLTKCNINGTFSSYEQEDVDTNWEDCKCNCKPDFEGENCDQIKKCSLSPFNNTKCKIENTLSVEGNVGDCDCICDDGYEGKTCEIEQKCENIDRATVSGKKSTGCEYICDTNFTLIEKDGEFVCEPDKCDFTDFKDIKNIKTISGLKHNNTCKIDSCELGYTPNNFKGVDKDGKKS